MNVVENTVSEPRRERAAGSVSPIERLMKDIVIPSQAEPGGGEGLFRLMADNAPVLIWVAGPTGECTFVSRGWLDFTGRELAQELGAGWAEGIHPDDRERCRSAYEQSLARREPFEIEYRLRRNDGEWRWMLDRGTPFEDPAGGFGGYLGAAIDITERRDAAEALRASEARYRRVLETCLEGVWIVDADGRTTYVNSAMAHMLGYSAGEMMGRALIEFIHPSDQELAKETLGGRDQGRTGQHEFCFAHRGGAKVWALVAANPTYEGDTYCGALAMVTDISERKVAEAQLQRLNQELERRVLERTAELAAANQELEAFCYSVSHDLRGPLRAIDGFSQAILEDHGPLLGEQGRGDLLRVRAAARRMGDLIDALLTLSRLSRMEMKRERVNLSEIAESFLRELRAAYPERVVDSRIESELVVDGDVRLIRVVVENLLSNAWKFSRSRPKAEIVMERCRLDGHDAVRVRDNGIGFDSQYAHKLFIPFERLHDAREFPGTGIGLATVQRILSRHGGTIVAESTLGSGATFTFTVEPSATPE